MAETHPSTLPALLRPWASPAGLVALALVVAQGVWRGILLTRGFFTQDDFLMLRLGAEPLSTDLVLQDYSGHLFPGGFLVAWAHAHHAPLSWSVVVVEVVVLQAVAALLAWLVLNRLLPGSWARVPLLAVALFCPVALWPTLWWAVAIQFLPVSIALLAAVWALLVHLQQGSRWAPTVVVVATAAGMLFQERAVLFPLVLGLVAVAFSPARGPRAVLDALQVRWRLWATLGVLCVAYLAVHRVLAPIEATSAGSAGSGVELVLNFVARNAVPGVVGGPWNPDVAGDSLLGPSWGAVVLAWTVLLAGVVWSLRRSLSAAWGWLLLLAYLVVDALLLFAGRAALGPEFGLIPRYAADVVPVLPVALGLVVRAALAGSPPDGAERPRRGAEGSRRAAVVALSVTGLYAVSAAVTTASVAHHSYNRADRAFVETLRAELRAQPGTVLLDGGVPDDLMIGWFGADGRVSTMIGLAPERPVFDRAGHSLRMVDARGRLRPIDLVAPVSARAGDDEVCGYAVRDQPETVLLADALTEDARVLARITYYTSAKGSLTVEDGGAEQRVRLRQGTATVDVPLTGPLDELVLRLLPDDDTEQDATVCVTDVTVGYPVARD